MLEIWEEGSGRGIPQDHAGVSTSDEEPALLREIWGIFGVV